MSISLKSLLISFLVTIVVAIIVLLIAVVFSTFGSTSPGIGAYAGGISQRFISGLLLSLPVVFIGALLIAQRAFRRGKIGN